MNHSNPETKKTLEVIKEFYEALFPIPSTFELPADKPNEFLYINELKEK